MIFPRDWMLDAWGVCGCVGGVDGGLRDGVGTGDSRTLRMVPSGRREPAITRSSKPSLKPDGRFRAGESFAILLFECLKSRLLSMEKSNSDG